LAGVDAREALLGRLFDHAALFPPASMSMPDALAEDRRARESEHAWLLGRFVCPASKLAQLGAEDRALTVIADADVPADGRIEAIEAHRALDFDGEVYVELPLDAELDARLDDLRARGLRAKVRCGGPIVPDAGELTRFVRGCRARGLVFKATAGLHHAYPTNGEHGFLNLLAAAVFGEEAEALAAGPGAFSLDEHAFHWGERKAGTSVLTQTRGTLFHSIGSCSFFEPVGELLELGLV
jgi:hypothetical protein